MPAWLTWLFGCGLVTAESAFLAAVGFESFCLQSGLIVAILIGLRRDFIPGALTLAAAIPVIEWYVGGPKGIYGLGLCVVFVALQSIRSWLPRDWGPMHFGAGAGAAVLHALVVAVGLSLTTLPGGVGAAVVWSIPVGVFGVLIGLWPAQWLLERGDSMFEGTRRRPLFD